MKTPMITVTLLAVLCSTAAVADKPKWAGSDQPPTQAQVEEHRDAMRQKAEHKENKEWRKERKDEIKETHKAHKAAIKEAHQKADQRIEKREKLIEEKRKLREHMPIKAPEASTTTK